jgi:hypothetical protein
LGLSHYHKNLSILLNPANPPAATQIFALSLLRNSLQIWYQSSQFPPLSAFNAPAQSMKGARQMDELIKRITEKTGISEDQAPSAVNTVSGFLKEKLPAPIAGQVDNVLSGAGGMTDKLGDAAAKVGGIFGGS